MITSTETVSLELLATDAESLAVDLMGNAARPVLIATALSAKLAIRRTSHNRLKSVSDAAMEDTFKTTLPVLRHVLPGKLLLVRIFSVAAVWIHLHADLVAS